MNPIAVRDLSDIQIRYRSGQHLHDVYVGRTYYGFVAERPGGWIVRPVVPYNQSVQRADGIGTKAEALLRLLGSR